jgi:hypothetical protein
MYAIGKRLSAGAEQYIKRDFRRTIRHDSAPKHANVVTVDVAAFS